MVVEKWSTLQSGVSAVQGYSARQCAMTLTLFKGEVEYRMLEYFFGLDPECANRSYQLEKFGQLLYLIPGWRLWSAASWRR